MGEDRTAATPVCTEDNGWTPVRDGDVYCSPRCGCRCTWQAYQEAVAGANALCALLGAPGEWKPEVWENFGWHYRAARGATTVAYRPSKPGARLAPKFEAWINVTARGAGGHGLAYIARHPEDPRAAVRDALALLRADLDAAEREYVVVSAGTAPPGTILQETTHAR